MYKNEQQKMYTFINLYKKTKSDCLLLVRSYLIEGTGYETRQASEDQPIVLILLLKGTVT